MAEKKEKKIKSKWNKNSFQRLTDAILGFVGIAREDNAFIPIEEENRDYKEYLEIEASG